MDNWTPRRLWGKLSLVQKFGLLFIIVGAFTAWTSNLALKRVLEPSFNAFEQGTNAEQVARTRVEIDSLNAGLRSSSLDYAVWDDMYLYAASPNRQLEIKTLTPLAYENFNADFIAVIGFEGKPVWSRAVNRTTKTYDDQESAQISPAMISGPFFAEARSKEAAGTYVKTTRGLYAIQSNWIRNSQGEGTPSAFFVVGRLLSASALSDAVQAKATVDTTVTPARLLEVASAPDHTVTEVTPKEIRNTIALLDMTGTPLATLTFPTSRRISQVGSGVIASAFATTGLSLAFLLALLALGVNRITVMRLQELRSWVRDYRSGGSAVNAALMVSEDEIGSLARQFDQLAIELAEAEELLRQQSYVQGKADSAVGLLHNVRNSLGPVQAKCDKWRREDSSPLGNQLQTALAELETGVTDNERREALERFVKAAATKLATQSKQRGEEIENLQTSVNQILAILADYDFASKSEAVIETVDLTELFRREANTKTR